MYHISNLLTILNLDKLGTLGIVAERSTGYTSGFQLPDADAYARRLADEAEAWLTFARERSRMKPETLVTKALHSLAFSLRHGAHDIAIPSKLTGTAKTQRVLWQVVGQRAPLGTRLDTHEDGRRVVVSLGDDVLGEVQSKHTPWLRPLVPFGARVYLVRVTGHESQGYRLGVNIAIGRAGRAVAALRHALGDGVGGDGYGGEGGTEVALQTSTKSSGDGALVPAYPEATGLGGDPADVVLWRGSGGTACCSVQHRVQHSPTGIEWGYRGSGPADLARSILLAHTDPATAERLYRRFKDEVIAAVPEAGGVLRATDIRRWVAAHAGHDLDSEPGFDSEPGGDGTA